MKLVAAAIQMQCVVHDVSANLVKAEAYLRQARDAGARVAVLPEMFNTGYGFCADYAPFAETGDGPTWRLLRARSREWNLAIAAGFVERDGRHLHDSIGFATPDGQFHVYRKRNLVFWERFRFYPGKAPLVVKTAFGRVGFAICADMIYKRVWSGYRDQIDLAIISAAWPDFADRETGKKHWLFGHVGPLSGEIPRQVARDLHIGVIFSNQSGTTRTTIPVLKTQISDHFAGQSCVCDGLHGEFTQARREEEVVVGTITLHSSTGPITWRSTSPSAPAAWSFGSEPSSSA